MDPRQTRHDRRVVNACLLAEEIVSVALGRGFQKDPPPSMPIVEILEHRFGVPLPVTSLRLITGEVPFAVVEEGYNKLWW